MVRKGAGVGRQRFETRQPGVHALYTPGPLGQGRELPAVAPLAAAPVPTAVAIRTLLLRPGFIHDQGPPRKL